VHGVLFVAFRRFLEGRFGAELADDVFAKQNEPSATGVYADDGFMGLLAQGATLSRIDQDRLLREFGAELISFFHERYASYFPPEGARRFLLQFERGLGSRIREALPGAAPPRMEVHDIGSGRLRMDYHSPRKMCPLLAGLLDGTSTHYQTPVRHHEESCARKGHSHCSFIVEVQQTLLPRSNRKK
jgi:predicted hydrocarbon binding protein